MKFKNIVLTILCSTFTVAAAQAEDCIPSLDPLCKKDAKKADDPKSQTLKMDLCRVGAERFHRIGFNEAASVYIPTTASTFDENLKSARCPQTFPPGSDIWVIQPNKPLSNEAEANRSHLETLARRCEKEAAPPSSAATAPSNVKANINVNSQNKTGAPPVTIPIKK